MKRKDYRPLDAECELAPDVESELTSIWHIVCEQYGYYIDPKNTTRRAEYVKLRFMFYYVAYETGYYSLEQLAIFTARKNHTSVIHGRESVEDKIMILPNGKPYDREAHTIYKNAVELIKRHKSHRFSDYGNRDNYLTAGYL